MILEMAVADAYAIAFEFVDRDKYPGKNDLSQYYQHPSYDGLKPSQYTDDTLRTISTAKTIMHGPHRWTRPDGYIEFLQAEFLLDPRDGFSRRFQQFLQDNAHKDAMTFMRSLNRKTTNGALMGCLPCGFLDDPNDVMLAAMMQAISTHSAETVPYAQALALSAHHLMRGELIETIPDWLDHCGVQADAVPKLPRTKPKYCRMGARSTTSAVFDLLFNFTSLSEMMVAAVEAGGDTDSVAALAVGLASLSTEVINDIPEHLVQGLEFGNQQKQGELMAVEALLRRQFLPETIAA